MEVQSQKVHLRRIRSLQVSRMLNSQMINQKNKENLLINQSKIKQQSTWCNKQRLKINQQNVNNWTLKSNLIIELANETSVHKLINKKYKRSFYKSDQTSLIKTKQNKQNKIFKNILIDEKQIIPIRGSKIIKNIQCLNKSKSKRLMFPQIRISIINQQIRASILNQQNIAKKQIVFQISSFSQQTIYIRFSQQLSQILQVNKLYSLVLKSQFRNIQTQCYSIQDLINMQIKINKKKSDILQKLQIKQFKLDKKQNISKGQFKLTFLMRINSNQIKQYQQFNMFFQTNGRKLTAICASILKESYKNEEQIKQYNKSQRMPFSPQIPIQIQQRQKLLRKINSLCNQSYC